MASSIFAKEYPTRPLVVNAQLLFSPPLLQDFIRKVCKPMYTEIVRDEAAGGVLGVVEFDSQVRQAVRASYVRCPPQH